MASYIKTIIFNDFTPFSVLLSSTTAVKKPEKIALFLT